jgi:hypothetical protein
METWTIIKGWPDYEISDQRRVRKRSSGEILKQWNGSVRLARNRYKRTWRKVEGLVDRGSVKQYIPPTTKDLSEPGEIWKAVTGQPGYMVSSLRRVWNWNTCRFVGHRVDKNGTRNVLFQDNTCKTVDKIYAEVFGYTPPTEPGEEWRESVSPGILVSNLGRLFSAWNLRLMTLQKRPNGYLFIEGRDRRWLVHRLVAFAFVPGRDIFRDSIDHINEDKTDNRAVNLRWCTREENNDFYLANHPIPPKKVEGQAAKTTPPESRSHEK